MHQLIATFSFIIFGLQFSFAGEEFCDLDAPEYKKVIPLKANEHIDNFLQAVNDRYLMFLGNGQLFDLQTGNVKKITSEVDPFPSPDEKVYVQTNGKELLFRSVEDALKNGKGAKVLYADKELKGVYNSVGLLAKNETESIYRVITGYSFMRDYKISFDKSGRPKKVIPVQKNRIKLCEDELKSIGRDWMISQPILSKDGQEVALSNQKTHSTVIYKIDGETGKCTLVDDLKIGTGKVNFSFNGKKIAFASHGMGAGPSRLYVYDRDSKKLQGVIPGVQNSHYAAFLPNGDLVFQDNEKVFVVDSARLNGAVFQNPEQCGFSYRTQIELKRKLQSIYEIVCKKNISEPEFKHLPLSHEKCLKLVKQYKTTQDQGVSSEDLEALCI